MLSIRINDIRTMTKLLFTEDAFDKFLLHDASVITDITTLIDGKKNLEFFNEEERETEKGTRYIPYARIRPFIFELIRGKRLPVSFKLILLTNAASTEAIRKKADFTACGISSLSMNILYKEEALYLTTGVSYEGFSLDRSPEKLWDETVSGFLRQKNIEFEET